MKNSKTHYHPNIPIYDPYDEEMPTHGICGTMIAEFSKPTNNTEYVDCKKCKKQLIKLISNDKHTD